jgi:hypothetical protein
VVTSLPHDDVELFVGVGRECEVVQARAQTAVEHARHHVRRLFEHEREATGVAVHDQLLDGWIHGVPELPEQPAPRLLRPR